MINLVHSSETVGENLLGPVQIEVVEEWGRFFVQARTASISIPLTSSSYSYEEATHISERICGVLYESELSLDHTPENPGIYQD